MFTAQRIKEAEIATSLAEKESEDFLEAHRNFATSNDPAVRIKGARLEAELKLRQQVFTTLTLNYEEALLEEKNDMPILNVLDEGDIPIDKSGPARTHFVLSWVFLVIGLSLLVEHRVWLTQRLRMGE